MKTIETLVWNHGSPDHERFVLCSTEDGMMFLSFDLHRGIWTDQNYDRVYCEVYGWAEPKGPSARRDTPWTREPADAVELLITA